MKNLYFLLILFCLVTSNVFAQDIYFKADNLTNGAGVAGTYLNYSVISSRQLGVSAEASWAHGGGGSVGNAIFDQIVITKRADIASNKIMALIAKGRSIQNVEIVSTVTNGPGGQQVVNKIELQDVYVTKITSSTVEGCVDGCPGIAESYEMVYKAIRITTYSQDSKTGKWTANPVQFTWNIPDMNEDF